jgi:hypothetical protein
MTLNQEDILSLKLSLRIEWLKDILKLYLSEDQSVKTIRAANLKRMLIDAEADLIALTDRDAAERHRKTLPEW